MINFSEYLKSALAKTGLSQRAAARKIGISAPFFNRMLKGTEYPGESRLIKICFHLRMNVTVAWVLIQYEKTKLHEVKEFLTLALTAPR